MSDKSKSQESSATYQLPPATVLTQAVRLSIVEDKPIMMDYWVDSLNPSSGVIIGVREGGEKLLVKSEDEYTSNVCKIYKVQDVFICVTENSIYLVSNSIKSKRIS
jgi:hypothetical protein